jgi:hypothetical protein
MKGPTGYVDTRTKEQQDADFAKAVAAMEEKGRKANADRAAYLERINREKTGSEKLV